MYQYIFLDLDGTLTDPGIGIIKSVSYALEKFGIEEKDRVALNRFIGPPLMDSFTEYYGFSEEQARQAIVYYRERFSVKGLFENEVYPGVHEMLKELKARGKKLVIATSKPDEFTIKILKRFELYDYFDFVAAATMDETRTRKDEVIQYGLDSLGVLYGYGDREELAAAGADYLAAEPEDVLKYCL